MTSRHIGVLPGTCRARREQCSDGGAREQQWLCPSNSIAKVKLSERRKVDTATM